MMQTYRALSALLDYPSQAMIDALPELLAVIRQEALLPAPGDCGLARLAEELAAGDLYDLQERWLLAFDRTRALSLHLFEHVHGESRDRGQAMVDLQQLYAGHGLDRVTADLPDYLPLFLEFLSIIPDREARELLAEAGHILVSLAERLEARGLAWAPVLRALEALAARPPTGEELAAVVADDGTDPADLEALDDLWADTPVDFGPGATDCGVDGLAPRIRAARRPPPDLPVPPPGRNRPVVTRSPSP